MQNKSSAKEILDNAKNHSRLESAKSRFKSLVTLYDFDKDFIIEMMLGIIEENPDFIISEDFFEGSEYKNEILNTLNLTPIDNSSNLINEIIELSSSTDSFYSAASSSNTSSSDWVNEKGYSVFSGMGVSEYFRSSSESISK